ncbi:hypothetical protein L208DRAFT_1405740 [Tricholoma matsutake]|nr:hypothetical protein L208DRAFT_1405740 [Tricholoma matsutake 945]
MALTQPSMGCTNSSSTFLQLPTEVTEGILSEIDAHRDLIALALTSRAFTDLIIPHHTEYRVIRLRHPLPYIWAHLARRVDLTRNIREVHLCAAHDYTARDRYPTTLSRDKDIDGNEEHTQDENRLVNICRALGHMRYLQVFTWAWAWGNGLYPRGTSFIVEERILGVVSKIPCLKHLALFGPFGIHVRDGRGLGGIPYPAWCFSGLLSLSLHGDVWVRPGNSDHICEMMKRSPDLEHLEFPMDFPRLKELRFRRLKRLKLPLQSGGTPSIDASSIAFLENHPTLEELQWFPIGQITLSASSLPSIKRLQGSRQVIEAFEATGLSRFIECLSVLALDPQRLVNMKCVDHASLRKLSIRRIPSLEHIHHIGERFTGITWLSMSYGEVLDLHVWFHVLSCFPNLEVFRGQSIWFAVHHVKEAMHLAIMELVQLCPRLRQLDYCEGNTKREARQIVIIREGSEGQHVRYEVRRSPPSNVFDVMEREFM